MDIKTILSDVLKRVVLGGDQDSDKYKFNLKDFAHTLKIAALGALGGAAVAFLKDVDAYNYGVLLDATVSGLVTGAIAAVQSFVDDRKAKVK